MIRIQKFEELGQMKLSWLHARYHFSFFRYHNPDRMGFGTLRVVNDDIVRAGGGFDTHHHQDMEIITYIRKGAITHKDSEENQGRTSTGDVQVMSAGTGIYHSEYNLESEDTVMYQIWIEPHTKGVAPSWGSIKFPEQLSATNLPLLVSGRDEDRNKNILHINQYASIYGGRIAEGARIKHHIKDQAFLLVSDGDVMVDGSKISKGDSAEISDLKTIEIIAMSESEVVIIDAFYFCPHHPVHGKGNYLKACQCRKPHPGMLLQAINEWPVTLEGSFLIGDKKSDLHAAAAANITAHHFTGGNLYDFISHTIPKMQASSN